MDKNRLQRFARLALVVAGRTVAGPGSTYAPRVFRPPQLLACLLVKTYLRLDYRTTEEVLAVSGRLRRTLGLRRVPDHTTLWWFARHRVDHAVIERALAETVRLVAQEREAPRRVALDSTGLWRAPCSRYFAWRAGRPGSQRGWLKWAIALWIRPQVLLAQRVRPGPCGDFSDLPPLAGSAHAVLPFDQLLADAGYDSEANHRSCRETLGIGSLIMAKPRRSKAVVATTPYRSEMCRLLGDPGDRISRRAYGQRWKAETVMSVSKRKWGEALTARQPVTQDTEALLRGVVYNLHRLVILGPS